MHYSINRIPIVKLLIATALLFVSVLALQMIGVQKVAAVYDGGQLIDNSIFLDAQSMNASQIQSFLVGRGGQIASRNFVLNCDAAGAQAKQVYLSLGAPCDQSIPASHIIYYASQVYGINPRVVLATLQKEQSLITATNPTDRQYAQAMGYGCPTSGSCDDSSNFFWQIDNGTWVLRFHYERARGNMTWWYSSSSWTCGTEKNLYKPNLYPGQNVNFYDTNGVYYRTHFIANAATSALYCYTPHAFNNHRSGTPAPQNVPAGTLCYSMHPEFGSAGYCYTGSYNFVKWFETWFGPSHFEPEKDYDNDGILNKFDVCKTTGGPQIYQGCPQNSLNENGGLSGDFNGDGFDDILVFSLFPDGETYNLQLYAGSANGFQAPTFQRTLGPAFGGWYYTRSKPVVVNVNNDAYSDLVIFHRGNNNEIVRHVLLGSASGIQASSGNWVAWQLPSQGWLWTNVRLVGGGDVNGDGYGDVVALSVNPDGQGFNIWLFPGSNSSLQAPVFQRSLLPTDGSWDFTKSKPILANIDGDDYADLVIYQQGFVNEVIRNILPGSASGIGAPDDDLQETQLPSQGWLWTNVRLVGVGDVNGDSYDDIVAMSAFPDNQTFNLWLYRGSASSGLTDPVFQRTLGPAQGGWQLLRTKPLVLNANGDGYVDMAVFHQGPNNEVVRHLLKGSNSGLQAPDASWVAWQFPSQGWMWGNLRLMGSGN